MRLSLLAALLVVIRDGAAAATPWRTRLHVPGWNDVDSVFRRFDRDGSGDMSVSELRRALNQLGLRHDTREAARVLARFDLDENGSLSKLEFNRLVSEVRGDTRPRGLPVWHVRQDRGALNNEVRKLIGLGQLDEAEAALRRSISVCCSTLGSSHPHTLNAQNGLAVTLWRRGRLDESERLQRLTLSRMEATLGPAHADTRTVRDNLAIALRQTGRRGEAAALERQNTVRG